MQLGQWDDAISELEQTEFLALDWEDEYTGPMLRKARERKAG